MHLGATREEERIVRGMPTQRLFVEIHKSSGVNVVLFAISRFQLASPLVEVSRSEAQFSKQEKAAPRIAIGFHFSITHKNVDRGFSHRG